MRALGLTCSRGGSVRLPGKNMKLFCGKPLLEWTLIQLTNTKHLTGFWLTTDDEAQAELGRKHGFKIAWQTKEEIDAAEKADHNGGAVAVRRGLEEAQKDAGANPYDVVCTFLPTQPLRKPDDIDKCIELWLNHQDLQAAGAAHVKDTFLWTVNNGVAEPFVFDKEGRFWCGMGNVGCSNPKQLIENSMREDGTPRTHDEAQKRTKNIFYPQELWQMGDIETQNIFDEQEWMMEHYILKGQGEKVYTDYKKTARSEYGYEQYAASYNKGVENNLLPREYRNSFFNHLPVYMESMPAPEDVKGWELVEVKENKKGQAERKVLKHIKANNGTDIFHESNVLKEPKPALIIGSGPSLDDALPLMKDWKGGIFISTSHISTLNYFSVDPSHIIAYDIQTSPTEFSWCKTFEGSKSVLVTHPGMHPTTLDTWTGRRVYFRSMDTSNFFFTNILPIAYADVIPSQMFLFSCSASAQMSIAHAMGYSPLFFVGMDFQAGRFKRWRYDHQAEQWICDPEGQIPEDVITSANGIPTNPLQTFYKRSFLCVVRIDRPKCLMTGGDKAIITEIPSVDIKDVIANQGLGFEKYLLTDQQLKDNTEKYLSRFNQFILTFKPDEHGKVSYRVLESHMQQNWEPDVRGYVTALAGELKKSNITLGLDIEENIRRFRWLKEEVAKEDANSNVK